MFDRKEYDKKYRLENKEKIKEYMKQYRKDNPEKIDKYIKQWAKNNPEKTKEHRKKYYIKNREKILEHGRQYKKENLMKRREYSKLYSMNNLDKIKEYNKRKRKTNLKYNLNHRMSTAIKLSLEGNKAGRHWEDLVGYTLKDLIERLKETMPRGHNWNDFLRGLLHIDHIIPKMVFNFNNPEDKEFKQCWSLYNLRLLPKRENLLKNRNFDNPILLGLLLKEMI